ncbi:MAG TPA: DUF4185 domain-containing protein [Gemmatimonadota bacterium]|jgi:hypothetical protein
MIPRQIRSAISAFACCVAGCSGGDPSDPDRRPVPEDVPGVLDFGTIAFDFRTHQRLAEGSDNWPLTWADDDHQYTSWGDGGGFGSERASLGVARIEGGPDAVRGVNVWTGAEHPGVLRGKSYGIVSVDGVLWMWVSPRSGAFNWDEARLYRSADHGATWTDTGVAFDGARDRVAIPSFLQFGRDYAGARDGFVYVYATNFHLRDWVVQRPGEIVLLRVPRGSLADRGSWEFFAGLDAEGRPRWTADVAGREPVLRDPNGVMHTSAIHNPGLARYLLVTSHSQASAGNIAIRAAPEPWGPWTTVLYESSWGVPHVPANTFYWNFSPKWLSADGRSFVMVFTGTDENDSWNLVRGTLRLDQAPAP